MNMSTQFDDLPSEITPLIFSYVKQRDCLEFMCASRKWFELIPEMTKSLWKDIDFSLEVFKRKSIRIQKCFGPLVQSVHVLTKNMNYIMKELIKHQCKIKELEVLDGINEITYIPRLYLALQFSGGNLYRLTLKHHDNVAPFIFGIGHLCPQLRYLCIISPKSRLQQESDARTRHNATPLFSNLVFLSLQYDYDSHEIEAILQQCPNLRVFQLTPNNKQLHHSLDFMHILNFCPYIDSFECSLNANYSSVNGNLHESVPNDLDLNDPVITNSNYTSNNINRLVPGKLQQQQQQQQQQQHQMHRFTCYIGALTPRIVPSFLPFLQQIQDTLTVLHINQDRFDNIFQESNVAVGVATVWAELENIRFPHLQQLTIICNSIVSTTLSNFIKAHSNNLKQLSLGTIPPILNGQIIKTLADCSKLEGLLLHISSSIQDPSRWRYREHTIELMPVIFPDNSHLLGNLQHLKKIEVSGSIVLSDPVLEVFSRIHSLQNISLFNHKCRQSIDDEETQMSQLHYNYWCFNDSNQVSKLTARFFQLVSNSGLIRFITSIGQHNNLQHLSLQNFSHSIDRNFISSIGNTPSLQSLEIDNHPIVLPVTTKSGLIEYKHHQSTQ
ncbi:hypothetical protein BDC45DRAFT_530134 [Circinella umbellata]|nr:hypothetical protein BDC45DRAFT_530134 [Circinella umbellata]